MSESVAVFVLVSVAVVVVALIIIAVSIRRGKRICCRLPVVKLCCCELEVAVGMGSLPCCCYKRPVGPSPTPSRQRVLSAARDIWQRLQGTNGNAAPQSIVNEEFDLTRKETYTLEQLSDKTPVVSHPRGNDVRSTPPAIQGGLSVGAKVGHQSPPSPPQLSRACLTLPYAEVSIRSIVHDMQSPHSQTVKDDGPFPACNPSQVHPHCTPVTPLAIDDTGYLLPASIEAGHTRTPESGASGVVRRDDRRSSYEPYEEVAIPGVLVRVRNASPDHTLGMRRNSRGIHSRRFSASLPHSLNLIPAGKAVNRSLSKPAPYLPGAVPHPYLRPADCESLLVQQRVDHTFPRDLDPSRVNGSLRPYGGLLSASSGSFSSETELQYQQDRQRSDIAEILHDITEINRLRDSRCEPFDSLAGGNQGHTRDASSQASEMPPGTEQSADDTGLASGVNGAKDKIPDACYMSVPLLSTTRLPFPSRLPPPLPDFNNAAALSSSSLRATSCPDPGDYMVPVELLQDLARSGKGPTPPPPVLGQVHTTSAVHNEQLPRTRGGCSSKKVLSNLVPGERKGGRSHTMSNIAGEYPAHDGQSTRRHTPLARRWRDCSRIQ